MGKHIAYWGLVPLLSHMCLKVAAVAVAAAEAAVAVVAEAVVSAVAAVAVVVEGGPSSPCTLPKQNNDMVNLRSTVKACWKLILCLCEDLLQEMGPLLGPL